MIMLLKGVSQNRVASGVRCSKRDVSRAARMVREHHPSLDELMGMTDRQVRERWFPAKLREADASYARPDMDSYASHGLYLLYSLPSSDQSRAYTCLIPSWSTGRSSSSVISVFG